MAESKNADHKKETSWRSYISASIAGVLTLAQLISVFFLEVDSGVFALRVLGWVLWLISIIFGVLPIIIFRTRGGISQGESYVNTTVLVQDGLYGIVRHPQYLAGILFNLALILISQHWLIFMLGLPAMVLMVIDIQKADKNEIEKFGDAYRDYMNQVPQINFITGIIRQIQHRRKKP
jgi:protein-S-isoprenylcysteine O-methyltransferase Ste14